jgi:uncharacterized protein (TIGR02145 family)
MKEAGTAHWDSPNTGATNSSGFAALPGGNRDVSGPFYLITSYGEFWAASEGSASYAWCRELGYDNESVGMGTVSKWNGFSARCLKN